MVYNLDLCCVNDAMNGAMNVYVFMNAFDLVISLYVQGSISMSKLDGMNSGNKEREI